MKISNIRKEFNKFSLNWQESSVFDKKVYGIIGANGCGKTTFMKILAGLIPADGGEVNYGNLTQSDITMVFRKPYMMHDTVYRNLIYPLELRQITPDEEKVEFYLQMAGLSDLREQYAPSLSSGEQQKLSFIRALIFSPKLILIDEAFSNMDIESVATFEEYILKIQQETPRTWIIISHQISNIKRLCNHVFFMNKGMVETQGSVDEILRNPQNTNLQKYLHYQAIV